MTEHGMATSAARVPLAGGYWQRFRRRLPWVALAVLAVVVVAIVPWPGLHGSTFSGLHLLRHWDVIGMSYVWYVIVIGLLVAIFPSRGHGAINH